MSSDDSWDFKIEKPKDKKEKPVKERSAKPRRKKAAVAQEKRKRRQEASDFVDKGPKVNIETPGISKRKSRSELAKEYEREEDKVKEPHPHEIYGSLVRRSIATALDFCLGAIGVLAVLTYKADFWINLELQVFGLNDFGQGPLFTYFGSLALVMYLIVSVFPAIVFGRSLGKSLAGVKIYGEELEPLGFLKTFLREILLKPISTLSVVGVLICYLSKKRKMLHDHLIGSTVRRY